MVNLWRYVPDFDDLDESGKKTLSDFLFIWSLFEYHIFKNNMSITKIRSVTEEWDAKGLLEGEIFWQDELSYFKERYQQPSDIDSLHLGNSVGQKQDKDFKKVISGEETEAKKELTVMFIIIYRYRNNLFYGNKWAEKIKTHRKDCEQITSIMCKILDCYLAVDHS